MINLKDRLTKNELEEFVETIFSAGSQATMNGEAHPGCAVATNNYVLFVLGFSKVEVKRIGDRLAAKMLGDKTVKKAQEADYPVCRCGHRPHEHQTHTLPAGKCKVKNCSCKGFVIKKDDQPYE